MKCYAVFTSGRELEVDKETYTELTNRINNGRTKGWYMIKHGPGTGCTMNIESLSSVEMVLTDKERKELEDQAKAQLDERLAKLKNKELYTGKRMAGSFSYDPQTCPINHAKYGKDKEPNVEVRYYMSDQDVKRYIPICTMCGWVGNLIKPAQVKNMYGVKVDDVPELELQPEETEES